MSWPGIELLYSGVAIRTASASRIAVAQLLDHGGRAARFDVLVVGRHLAQAVELDQLRPRGQPLGGGPQQGAVQRVAAQAAGDAEHPHRYSASSTSSSSTAIATS